MLDLSRRSRTVMLAAFCLGAWAIESCGGGGDGDTTGPPPGSTPVSTVEVQPNPLSLTPGQTAQLTVTLKAADGSTLTGRTVTWSTSAAAVATVDGTGKVTAVSAGTASITATSEGKSGSTALTVTAAPVATVEVIPNPATVAIGQSSQLAAVLKAQDGTELTGRAVAWSTSDAGIATVSDAGVLTGVAAGSATITATSEGKTGTSAVTVSAVAVASVQVTPPTAAVDVGGTTQLTATAKDANGATLSGRPFAWTTSSTSIATVSPAGLVTGIGVGTATITATSEGIKGTSSITVAAAAGTTRTWVGGAAGHLTDWFTATNWNPAGVPIAIDSARVPATANAAEVVGADAQVAQLTITGGIVRIKGNRLLIKANPEN